MKGVFLWIGSTTCSPVVCLLLVRPSAAQFSATYVTPGKAEHVLSGIDIFGKIDSVIATYGRPDSVFNLPVENAPKGSAAKRYIWARSSAKLSITTQHYVNEGGTDVESETYVVEVEGNRPSGEIGRTGAGLSLGDTLEKD